MFADPALEVCSEETSKSVRPEVHPGSPWHIIHPSGPPLQTQSWGYAFSRRDWPERAIEMHLFIQSPAAWLRRTWDCELCAQDPLVSSLPSHKSLCFFSPHFTPTCFCPNKACFCSLENRRKSVVGSAEQLSKPARYREPFQTVLEAQGGVKLV